MNTYKFVRKVVDICEKSVSKSVKVDNMTTLSIGNWYL